MKMSAEDQAAVKEALRAVRVCGERCEQQPDLEAVRIALDALWAAQARARIIVNTADANTRAEAQARNTAELFARLERTPA